MESNVMIIKGERLKRALLVALADTDLQKILDAAMYQSKSVNQIIKETNISHTTAYRKIKVRNQVFFVQY